MVTARLPPGIEPWIVRDPARPPPPAHELRACLPVIRANHLEALMSCCFDWTASASDPLGKVFRAAARQGQVRVLRYRAAAEHMARVLEPRGIPCLGLRGSFADRELYDDRGGRFFTDLDLLVPGTAAGAALKGLRAELGYALEALSLPPWFYRRHHLHWPLRHPVTRIACDLHWAVDHPYSLLRIDYDAIFRHSTVARRGEATWRRPAPLHALLLQSAHLGKEFAPLDVTAAAPDFTDRVLESGKLLKWIDAARMIVHHGTLLDWDEVFATSRAWYMAQPLAFTIRGCARLFPALPLAVALPRATGIAPRSRPVSPGMAFASRPVRAIARRGGFRAARLAELHRFLCPPADYFPAPPGFRQGIARLGHLARASGRLVRAGLDLLLCMGLARIGR